MAGLIVAGLALVVLILFFVLKSKLSLSDEELKEFKGILSPEEERRKAEEEERQRRKLNLSKAANLLVQVVEDGSVAEIQQAIANGINILQKLENNQTLLMIAVKNNPSPEVVQFLLDEGIEINDVDDSGQTALILAAAFNSNPEVITTLLDNGADKTITDKSGKTAADYVALNSSFFGTDIPSLLKTH